MVIRAIADILEYMIAGGKRRLADPIGPFAAHVRISNGVPVHPLHKIMTTNASIGPIALGHFGAGVVRAPGTEIGPTRHDIACIISTLRRNDLRQTCMQPVRLTPFRDQDLAQLLRDHHRIKRIAGREQLLAPPVHIGITLVPAINAPPRAIIKQRFLDLHLDQFALFLDDDNQVEALGPIMKPDHIQRPDLPDLIGRDAQPCGGFFVDPQQIKRMDKIKPVLARCDQPDTRTRLSPDPFIHVVGAAERLGGKAFVIDHSRLLGDGRIDQTDVQPILGQIKIGRDKLHPVGITINHRCDLDRVLHGFQADPNPGKPRQRISIDPVIQNFLHARRRYDRHIGIDHRPIGLVQGCRRFARVIITHRHDHPAVGRGACHVHMAHHIARAINPRPLAIPQAKHTIVFAFTAQFGLLAAPQGCRGQIFVQPRLKGDLRLRQQLFGALHLHIDGAKRRSAIACDISGCVQPRRRIARALHQHQAHKRLRAVQQHRRFAQIITVIQRNILPAHHAPPMRLERLEETIGQKY